MLGLNAADFLSLAAFRFLEQKKTGEIFSPVFCFINLNALVFVERRFYRVRDCRVQSVFL